MSSTGQPKVFVNEYDQVYSSPNANFLPAIPNACCDIDNPRDTVIPHWASIMRPELPFTPIEFGPENYIISRLDLPEPVPLEQDHDGKWRLHAKYQEKFYIVEMSLIHIIAKFRETFHSLFSLDYKPYRSPAKHGYLRFPKEPRHARISATQS
jgi:hypothetical protein